jgi:hypothetical protein
MCEPMTAHEKECAIAALVLRIERAKDRKERDEMRRWYLDVLRAPLLSQ